MTHEQNQSSPLPEFRSEYEEKVAVSPGLWFELHGAIEPKMGVLRKSPELACTILQQRKDEVVEYCLLHQIPCRLISLKARQDGSSTFSVGIAYRYLEAMRATGCIIGGAHAQGTNLFRKLKVFAEHDTFSRRVQTKVLDREARFGNGSLMEQLTASNPEAGRSGTYQVVLATEVARWAEEGVANAADVLAGLLKCVPLVPFTFVELESTARGKSGDFYDRWQNAITLEELKAGKRGFVRVFAAWFELPERRLDPALELGREQIVPPEQVEELKAKYALDEQQIAWMQWSVREECDKDFDKFCEDYPFDPETAFRSSGRTRFLGRMVDLMVERAKLYPPKFGSLELVDDAAIWREVSSDDARVVRWEEPRENLRYLVSIDSMTGETQVGGKDPDNHSVGVWRQGYFDPTRGWRAPKLVARLVHSWRLWETQKRYELRWDIDVLEEQVWRLCLYYGRCLIVPEMNADRGLVELLKQRNGAIIYVRVLFNKREQKEQNALGWYTDPKTREAIIENLARAIREDGKPGEGVVIYCPITLAEFQTFVVKTSGRSEASSGKHDDNVLMTAIGLACINGATTYAQAPRISPKLPPDLERLIGEQNPEDSMAMRW